MNDRLVRAITLGAACTVLAACGSSSDGSLPPDDTATTDAGVDTVVADGVAPTDSTATDSSAIDTATTDTTTADTAATDTASADITETDAGASCNTLTQVGGTVTVQGVATAPVPLGTTGGTVASGTYVLTALTVYTGTGGFSGSLGDTRLTTTIAVTSSGAAGQSLEDDVGKTTTHRSTTNTVFTSGTNKFTQTWSCRFPLPLNPELTGSYEVSGTTLKLFYDASKTLYVLEKK